MQKKMIALSSPAIVALMGVSARTSLVTGSTTTRPIRRLNAAARMAGNELSPVHRRRGSRSGCSEVGLVTVMRRRTYYLFRRTSPEPVAVFSAGLHRGVLQHAEPEESCADRDTQHGDGMLCLEQSRAFQAATIAS